MQPVYFKILPRMFRKSFIMLLLMNHQVSAWDIFYPEPDHHGVSCYPYDSCLVPRKEAEDNLWNDYSCECGMHCVEHGTCCSDSPYVGGLLHFNPQGETCEKLTGMNDAVLVVSECPNRWRHWYAIRNKCENATMETDPVGMIPVTNLVTHVTYKNYFCAICNGDAGDVFFWNIAFVFQNKAVARNLSDVTKDIMVENVIYDYSQQSWGIRINDIFYKSKLELKLPPSLRKTVKKCYVNTVSECDLFCEFNELRYKCLSYYAPIKVKAESHSIIYRNIHCALCNNANITEGDSSICKLDDAVLKQKPKFSFAVLLDINRKDGDLVGRIQRCDNNETWDPFFKKCRALVCALPGYVVKNGECVPS